MSVESPFDSRFNEGMRAYHAGYYEWAAEQFTCAYALNNEKKSVLFNIAQSYRLAGLNREAARYYRLFLDEQPDSPHRSRIEREISQIER